MKKFFAIPYPRVSGRAYDRCVLSGEGALSRSDPSADRAKAGRTAAPRNGRRGWWLKVERREAQRPTSLGARGLHLGSERVGALSTRRKPQTLPGRKAATRQRDPKVPHSCFAYCLAPHPKPSLTLRLRPPPARAGRG